MVHIRDPIHLHNNPTIVALTAVGGMLAVIFCPSNILNSCLQRSSIIRFFSVMQVWKKSFGDRVSLRDSMRLSTLWRRSRCGLGESRSG